MLDLWDGGRGLVVLAVICLLGLLWRQRAGRRYARIVRQCDQLDTAKDRRLRILKAEFEELSRMRNGISNLTIFLQKFMRGYRVRGLTLQKWNQLANIAAGLDILGGLALAGLAFQRNQDMRTIVFYGAAGVVLGGAGILFGILIDNARREEQTLICLQNSFENRIIPSLSEDKEPGRRRGDWIDDRDYGGRSEEEAPPVYTIRPEEEQVIEEIFQEYFS